MKTLPSIEPLEARIAPASAFVTYIDADGDLVKITATGSGAPGPDLGDLTRHGNGQLQKLTLDAGFALTDITFTVTKKPGGDGFADVGAIDATGFDLGNVTVKGDLGQIDVGNGDPEFPALKTLSVRSLGRYAAATQTGVPDFRSNFNGALLALKVTGDIKDAFVRVGDGANLGSVTVGGSIIGGTTANSGEIFAEGNLGAVVVKGDVIGGSGSYSGSIGAGGTVKSMTIGGSLVGAFVNVPAGQNISRAGSIEINGDSGPISIGGDVIGGRLRGDGSLGRRRQ